MTHASRDISQIASAYFKRFGWDPLYSEYVRCNRNADLTAAKLARPEEWTGHHAVERECLHGITKQLDAAASEMAAAIRPQVQGEAA